MRYRNIYGGKVDEGKMNRYSQNILINSGEYDEEIAYWTKKLEGSIEGVGFPENSIKSTFLKRNFNYKISNEISDKLMSMSNDSPFALYFILFSGVSYLLNRYARQEDIISAMPSLQNNENEESTDNDLLPIRVNLNGEKTFKELLNEIKDSALEADHYQNIPSFILKEIMGIRDEKTQNSFLKTIVSYGEIHEMNALENINESMHFIFENNYNEINVRLIYNTETYTKEFIEQIIRHLENYYKQIINNPNIKLEDIEILNIEEKQRLLSDSKNLKVNYNKNKCVHELFEEQVKSTPNNIAISFEGQEITYLDLNKKANRLARLLRKEGIKPDDFVAIIAEKSIEMIVGILATIKAGGTYVPINPSYPDERIKFMLDDCKAKIVLSGKNINISSNIRSVNLYDENNYCESDDDLENVNTPSDLIYLIYTSGTTGKPKGVMIEHRNVVRLFKNDKFQFDFNDKDIWILLHSYCFDFSVWEIYGALLFGGKLIVLSDEKMKDLFYILEILQKEKVTVLNQVPSAFYNLMSVEEKNLLIPKYDLRYLIFGGEALKPNRLQKWHDNHENVKIINMYGITETTVHVTYKEITEIEIEKGISDIGTPIPTLKLYVFNGNQLCGIGMAGELCVAGEGLARGYLNQNELTLEKFTENPEISGERIYRTGDLVRWLSDGSMEYLGRIDEQVKVRGFRIELGEIENIIREEANIEDAVVIIKKDNEGENVICAYLIMNGELKISDLKNHLSMKLADYMIPAYFKKIDVIPLTSNGKLNKRELPDIEVISETEYVEPKTELEKKLANIFSEILEIKSVGINDNFFEIGGHSLRAIKLINEIEAETGIRLQVNSVFLNPTIKKLSCELLRAQENGYSNIPVAEKKEYYKMSSAQKRLFVINELDDSHVAYNMPLLMEVKGNLEYEKVKYVFMKLVERHEALRTSFCIINEEAVQKIHENVNLDIDYIEIETCEMSDLVRPFDLENPPLIRIRMIKTKDKKYLFFDMHHIISDAFSMNILVNEFSRIYNDENLEPLKIQYKDYSEWMEARNLEPQKEFWLSKFKEKLPRLELPLDYDRSSTQSYNGRTIRFVIDRNLKRNIVELTQQTQTTEYMVLLSAIAILLSKYSNQEDIVIGSPISGRTHKDTENILGMFVNTLAMRTKPNGNKAFLEFLNELKENCLKAFENQEYPFEDLVDSLNLTRNLSRNPIFDVMFVLQNNEVMKLSPKGVELIRVDNDYSASKFDLVIDISAKEDKYEVAFEYCTDLFKESTILEMQKNLTNILEEIVNEPAKNINTIGVSIEKVENYNKLKEEELQIDLPLDFSRTNENEFKHGFINKKLGADLSGEILHLCSKFNITLDSILISAYSILLMKYSGQNSVNIRYVNNMDSIKKSGLLINSVMDAEKFEYFVKRTFDNINKMKENSLSSNIIFAMEKENNANMNSNIEEKFDVMLRVYFKDNEIFVNFDYNVFLFKQESITIMLNHYINILKNLISTSDILINNIDMIDETEKNLLINGFNNEINEDDTHKMIVELFEDSVRKFLNNTAVISGEEKITYDEINKKINMLARYLLKNDIKKGCKVGVIAKRSIELVIAIYAILKTGATYVPIGINFPEERKRDIIDQCNINYVLTNIHEENKAFEDITYVDLLDKSIYDGDSSNLNISIDPEDIAYIIFTSGTTGKPKGALLPHRGLANISCHMQKKYPVLKNDVILFKTGYTFDVSLLEFAAYFHSGGSLAILEEGEEKNPLTIINVIYKEKITHIHFVPAMLNVFLYVLKEMGTEKLKSLKYILAAGEELPVSTVNKLNEVLPHLQIGNLYGPTEASILSTTYTCDNISGFKSIPIGKPVQNSKLLVLDKNNNLQGIGVPGELFIGGVCTGKGYINEPDLTNEKFVNNLPYLDGYFYRSGDIVRWLPDGNIEYLGRKDNQVKIRGFRIELDDIRNALMTYEKIDDCTIIVCQNEGRESRYLCVFYVSKYDIKIEDIKTYLLNKLPEYMVPSSFFKLDKIPISINGKVDRKKLIQYTKNSDLSDHKYVEARNDIELRILKIWEKLLDVRSVGITDNFFELGGQSLLATIMMTQINKEFNIAVKLKEIFQNSTIIELAELVKSKKNVDTDNIDKAEDSQYYPATYEQKKIYTEAVLRTKSTSYNIPAALRIYGDLNINKLNECFKTIIERHEILRTSFVFRHGEILQRINEDSEFKIEIIDKPQSSIDEVIQKFIKAFSINNGSLIRSELVCLGKNNHLLLVDMHHIISDGTSIGIIIKEILSVYKGEILPELKIQYKDYAVWAEKKEKGFEVQQSEFWLNRFKNGITPLQLPTIYKRPDVRSNLGTFINFNINEDLKVNIDNIINKNESTLFMYLISVYYILLSKYTEQKDFIIGTPISGRNYANIQNLIGLFIKMIPLRINILEDESFLSFLERVKDNTLSSFENQDYHFDNLVKKVDIKTEPGRNFLFDVVLVLQNEKITKMDMDELEFEFYPIKWNMSKYDILIEARENSNEINFKLEYCTELFNEDFIRKFSNDYLKITNIISNNQNIKIRDISLLDDNEIKLMKDNINDISENIDINFNF